MVFWPGLEPAGVIRGGGGRACSSFFSSQVWADDAEWRQEDRVPVACIRPIATGDREQS